MKNDLAFPCHRGYYLCFIVGSCRSGNQNVSDPRSAAKRRPEATHQSRALPRSKKNRPDMKTLVTEAANKEGEEFGEERLIAALCEHRGQPADQTLEAVTRLALAFGGSDQADDLTMIVARVVETPGTAARDGAREKNIQRMTGRLARAAESPCRMANPESTSAGSLPTRSSRRALSVTEWRLLLSPASPRATTPGTSRT